MQTPPDVIDRIDEIGHTRPSMDLLIEVERLLVANAKAMIADCRALAAAEEERDRLKAELKALMDFSTDAAKVIGAALQTKGG